MSRMIFGQVTLAQVLAARDARVLRQLALLETWGAAPVPGAAVSDAPVPAAFVSGVPAPEVPTAVALVSVTLVSPGPVKDSPARRALMDLAESRLTAMLAEAGVEVLDRLRTDAPTGPELIIAARSGAGALKRIAVALEEREPWGRLVDADVIGGAMETGAGRLPVPVNRADIGEPARRCLLCGEAAAVCAALRRHTPEALRAEVERLLALANPPA